jgi:HEAT repeat protein
MSRTIAMVLALFTATAALAAPQPRPLPEPTRPDLSQLPSHSNDRTVKLLVQMLVQPELGTDPLLREQVVLDLGRTTNYSGVATLLKQFASNDWRTRQAAARALGQLPSYWVAEGYKTALADKDNRVAREAMLSAVQQHYAPAAGAIEALIARGDAQLTAEALNAMTALGASRSETDLIAHLADAREVVRLAALHQAAAAPAGAAKLNEALLKTAAGGDPSLRAAALMLIAQRLGAAAVPTLRQAAADSDWRVRAAAIDGLGCLAAPDPAIAAALKDPMEPVRFAACRACQRTKDPAAFEPLWQVMTADPWKNRLEVGIADVRKAAREALTTNTNPELAVRCNRMLAESLPAILAVKVQRRIHPGRMSELYPSDVGAVHESLAAAGYILARTGCDNKPPVEAIATLLKEHTDSDPALVQVTALAGVIGDKSLVEPLKDYLAYAYDTAVQYYNTRHDEKGPSVAFEEASYMNALRSLFALDAEAAMPFLDQTVDFLVKDQRFDYANEVAMDILVKNPDRVAPERADHWLSQFIIDAHDPAHGRYTRDLRWRAAHLAGQRKFAGPKTAEALGLMLNDERLCRDFIYVAAWALQEINTGKTPDLTEPVVHDAEGLAVRDLPAEQ